jgi:energy-coupling factor transport system permease protein
MNGNFIIGRYIPGKSIVHRLDARAKLATGFYFFVILLMANNWQTYGALTMYTLLIIKLTRIPFRFFIKGVKPLIQLIIFTVVLQLLFSNGGAVYFQLGPLSITRNGILSGVSVFFRFTLTIFMSTAISLTTRPIDLTDAVESLLSPLKFFKVPVQDIALMLTIAMRFIPTLIDEATRIMKAQQSRGVEFGEGNLFEQMKKVIPVFLPLFISSFYRAEEMANALDVRGYQGNKKRTKLRIQKWRVRDTLYLLSYMCLTGVIILVRG